MSVNLLQMANNISTSKPKSSTGFHSEIDLSVELRLFPVMIPSLFLPNVGERLRYISGYLPGGLKELPKSGGREGQSRGDDSEEEVYRVLENYDRDNYMVVFHGTEIYETTMKRIIEEKDSYPVHFSDKIDRNRVKKNGKIYEFDFIVIHERFVAVLEVKGMSHIQEGCMQLQQSFALVESEIKNGTVYKILCCPNLKNAEKAMTPKDIFLVCGDGLGFGKNLNDLLDKLQLNKTSMSRDFLKTSTQNLAKMYYGDTVSEPFRAGKDSEKIVYEQLQSWKQNQGEYMDFFHGIQITRENSNYIQKGETYFSPYDFVVKENITTLSVQLKTRNEKFDFVVVHESFVAVLEVVGSENKNIEDGCTRLQQSAAFVKSVMEDVVANKILCCPKLTRKVISSDVQDRMNSENMFIVCGDGSRFSDNLQELLNTLKGNNSMTRDLLKDSTPKLASRYLGSGENETFRPGDDSEEIVYKQLQIYQQDNQESMDVIRGAQITVQHSENIWKDGTCFSPFDFIVNSKSKTLKVHLKQGKQKLDFIIVHKNFVAVVEVVGLKDIEDSYIKLQKSVALVKSAMDGDTSSVIHKVLCCPNIKHKKIECPDEMHSENMYIVCDDDGEGFKTNFKKFLDELAKNGKSKPWNLLKKLTEHIEYVYYIGAVMNDTFRIKKCNKLSPGKLVRAMDFFIRTQNVQTDNLKLLTSFISNEDINNFNPDHAIYLTPQQDAAYKKKEMLLIGAAGTGKTALIKAKVIELAKFYDQRSRRKVLVYERERGLAKSKACDKIVIVTSAESNRTNFTNKFDNVQIWTPRDLENKFKLGDIVKDLREIHNWIQERRNIKKKVDYESMGPEEHLERARIKFESENVMDHLSRIVGVNVEKSITHYFGYHVDVWLNSPSRPNSTRSHKKNLPAIKDPEAEKLMKQVEKLWEETEKIFVETIKKSHFFMDDAFSGNTNCHDIFTYFALKCIGAHHEKYFWIAGDLTQLMYDHYDENKHFTLKLSYDYLQMPKVYSWSDEYVVCINAVMRCSKCVFNAWKPVRKTVEDKIGHKLFPDTFTNEAEYGFRYPGSVTVLKDFTNVVDVVKDIMKRIKFLTGDKFLTNSSFAVLVCKKNAIDAVRKPFEKELKDFTQSIETFQQDGVENKIILDTAENSIGLEWPVVFVVYSSFHDDNDHDFTIRKYLAYSRCRVRLFVYPELRGIIFFHLRD